MRCAPKKYFYQEYEQFPEVSESCGGLFSLVLLLKTLKVLNDIYTDIYIIPSTVKAKID